MKLNEKNIFLLDGAGALLSAVFTGLLLPVFSEPIGIQVQVLRSLAVLPLMYGIYSLGHYFFTQKIKPWMLVAIVIANIFYCILSALLIAVLANITSYGQFLLFAEIVVVIGVIAIEFKVLRNFLRGPITDT